jgi:hypothetical protein
MDVGLFEEVAAILPSLVSEQFGPLRQKAHRYGIKVWFGAAKPSRDHYEAQVVGAGASPSAKVLALEIGFHAEHQKEADNDAVLERLLADEAHWREIVGPEPTAGPFLGRAEHWRRISELWDDPDLGDPELPFEIAARLTDYITALQPLT